MVTLETATRWLATAQPGARLAYYSTGAFDDRHLGYLVEGAAARPHVTQNERDAVLVSAAVWEYANAGYAHLVQRRNMDGTLTYLVEMVRPGQRAPRREDGPCAARRQLACRPQ